MEMIMASYRSFSAIKLTDILLRMGCRIIKHIPNSRKNLITRKERSYMVFFNRYPSDFLFRSQKALTRLPAVFLLVIIVDPL